jgi:hypothetical protein
LTLFGVAPLNSLLEASVSRASESEDNTIQADVALGGGIEYRALGILASLNDWRSLAEWPENASCSIFTGITCKV